MEHKRKPDDDQFLVTLSDILAILRKSKKKIFLYALTFTLLLAAFSLTNSIRYQAEASFREKSVKSGNISTSMLQFLTSGSSLGDNEVITMMRSRKLMKKLIEQNHLQAELIAFADIDTPFKNVKNNLKLVWASLRGQIKPALSDICCPLKVVTLNYPGELPLAYKIDLNKDKTFRVFDLLNSSSFIGEGTLGELFQIEQLSFTLIPTTPNDSLKSQTFFFAINSIAQTAKNLSKSIDISAAKEDKTLLELTLQHRNRQQAAEILNSVMKIFHKDLLKRHQDISNQQLEYLYDRKELLSQDLRLAMDEHAHFVSHDLCEAGFFDTDQEMEFLSKSQHDYKQKMIANELEIRRLENFNPNQRTFYEGNSSIINEMLGQIRINKQSRDSLEIELQKKMSKQPQDVRQDFVQQLAELNQIQQYLHQLATIKQSYNEGTLPDITLTIFNDPRFLLKGWVDNIQVDTLKRNDNIKQNFQAYLSNLERLLGVYQRILQERIIHQQNPSDEYKGISLDVATTLYLDYSKKIVEIEGHIRQNAFFIHQMEDPTFEITSLSAGLEDPVSTRMIQQASSLILNLRDHNNQSIREHERIKAELDLQRTFLKLHLEQMIHLMKLNKDLFEEKIFTLQNVRLELINQQISLLEKSLQDYVQSRLEDLDQEKILIKKHLEKISAELASLPKKWVSQQLLQQELKINQMIVEEIARLVETKTISHKFEIIQSSPLDYALPPVHPIQPKFLLWTFLGLFLGGFFGAGITIGTSIAKGIPVSSNNLKLLGYQVAGNLITPLHEKNSELLTLPNRETLRRIQNFFEYFTDNFRKTGIPFLILEGKGPHYIGDLVKFFMVKGKKILIIDLFSSIESSTGRGLSEYLKGKTSSPVVVNTEGGNILPAGGEEPHLIELISTPLFQTLLNSYRNVYDEVFIVSSAEACSSEAEALLKLFPYAAITLQSETSEDLSHYAWIMRHQSDCHFCFVVAPDEI